MESSLSRLKALDDKTKAELPYDPDDVNIRLQAFRVSDLIKMIDGDALDILKDDFEDLESAAQNEEESHEKMDIESEDDLQRKKNLWEASQKSRFIESLMIKLPIPLFYFDGSHRPWRVVDGLQRLNTIVSFLKNDFKLTDLEYLKNDCEGLKFSDEKFPPRLRRRIADAEIISYVINPGTPPEVKYNIFKRINTGALKLNGQEIRNAFFRGGPSELTKTLARSEEFKLATDGKVSNRRMNDREYVNRFIAFQIFGYEEYGGKMDEFLSKAMGLMLKLKEPKPEFDLISHLFKQSMKRSYELFGEMYFRRPLTIDNTFSKIPNKALFDTVSWNLSRLEQAEFDYLLDRKSKFTAEFKGLVNKDPMYKAINDTTGSKTAVKNRFVQLKNLITAFLNDRPYSPEEL